MKFTDLDQSEGIGSNCQFIELGPFKIIIDSGLHPEKVGNDALPKFSLLEDHTIDFIILTHCHLDHLGSLPVLKRKQPEAQILTSFGSKHLCRRMLYNSHSVMMRQREEQGIAEYPLYTKSEIETLDHSLLTIQERVTKRFEKQGHELSITFHHAGHIPGAISVELEYKRRKIFFTGDMLFAQQRILDGAQPPPGPFDTIVTETTRGLTPRTAENSREDEISRLINHIAHTLDRGGNCLIPVFALGRMQEILSIINTAVQQKQLPKAPVFCSGLGMDIADFLDQISKRSDRVNFRKKLFKQLDVKKLRKDIQPGLDFAEKGIFVVSSGMLIEHTPSYHAAAALLDHHRNSICFVGYCDPKTPGGKLLKAHQGDKFLFEALDYTANIRAQIEKFDLSGHADREELLAYIQKVDPRAVVLSHGDPGAREWFEDSILNEMPGTKVVNPIRGESVLI